MNRRMVMQFRTTQERAIGCDPRSSRWHVFTLGFLILTWGVTTSPAQPNTGMADPAALVKAYEKFAADGGGTGVVKLSLSNLRGLSSESVNAGGSVMVDLTTGVVDSMLTAPASPPEIALTGSLD